MEKNWKKFYKKRVRLIIEDIPFPKPKDGIFKDIDETHIWLEIEHINDMGIISNKNIPFSRTSVKRVELRE